MCEWRLKRELLLVFFGVALCSVPMLLGACSGGTRGSGGTVIQGTVSRTTVSAASQREQQVLVSSPFPNVVVTIAETGESNVTDQDGFYLIESARTTSSIEFVLDYEGVTASIVIDDIPTDAPQVIINFSINVETNVVNPTLVDVTIPSQESSNTQQSSSAGNASSGSNGQSTNSGTSEPDSSSNSNSSGASDDDSTHDNANSNDDDSDDDNSNSSGNSNESDDDSGNSNDDADDDDDDDDDETDNSGPG